MRTFELTARVDAISRGDGRSATAAAAYRACCSISCDREGRTHDYTRKRGLEASAIILPAGTPDRFADRATLWNAAEMRERNGKRGARAGQFKEDAQVAREVLFTFPTELSADGRLAAATRIARHLVDKHQVAADFSLHLPGKDGDQQNFHCHLLMTTRRLDGDGFGAKVREWSNLYEGRERTKDIRSVIAAVLNDQLRQEGKADLVHVEHRSFAARGSGQRPTQHQGPNRTNILRRQQGMARQAWERQQNAAIHDRQAREIGALESRQQFAREAKSVELAERQRAGEQAIQRDLTAQRQADQQKQATGIRGAFRSVTGRAGRDAFEAQAREAQRVQAASQKVEALRTQIATERRTFADGQRREHAALVANHKQEATRLQSTVAVRSQIDRSAERAARQPSQWIDRQQEQERSRGWNLKL